MIKGQKKNITTTIDIEQYELAVKNNWKWSELLNRGIGSMVKPDVMQEQIEDQRYAIDRLKEQVRNLRIRVERLSGNKDE